MQESNHEVLGALTRFEVDKLQAGCLSLLESLLYTVYIESNMVYTSSAAVLLNELGDG